MRNPYLARIQKIKFWTHSNHHVGTLRLKEGKFPEIKLNGKWLPICGHYFWDNNYGATLFCKKLSSRFTFGTVKRRYDRPLGNNGLFIGRCRKTDKKLLSCTGHKNIYSTSHSLCAARQKASVEIKCSGIWSENPMLNNGTNIGKKMNADNNTKNIILISVSGLMSLEVQSCNFWEDGRLPPHAGRAHGMWVNLW